jgi:hypothetical protein
MWLKQEYAKGNLQVTYLKTSEMPADGLTKALPRQGHERFLAHLNLHYINHKVDISITSKEQVNREGEDRSLLGRTTPSP